MLSKTKVLSNSSCESYRSGLGCCAPGVDSDVVAVPLALWLRVSGHTAGELGLHPGEHLTVADRLQEQRRLQLRLPVPVVVAEA